MAKLIKFRNCGQWDRTDQNKKGKCNAEHSELKDKEVTESRQLY